MVQTFTYTLRKKASLLGGVVTFSVLAYVDIICVKLEGKQYDIIYTGTPNSRQVKYDAAYGRLTFGTPILTNGTLFVIYQH